MPGDQAALNVKLAFNRTAAAKLTAFAVLACCGGEKLVLDGLSGGSRARLINEPIATTGTIRPVTRRGNGACLRAVLAVLK